MTELKQKLGDSGIFVDRWIPLSERLPYKGQRVLVTTFGIVTEAWLISNADEKAEFCIIDPINHQVVPNAREKYQIRAWMSLPEPYNADMRCNDEG